ncbi:MAG: hypothetical protein K2J00_06865 [Bacteroidaceae bacterium]|nr:hypothetical protein [Bacteroidaceae bacterium]
MKRLMLLLAIAGMSVGANAQQSATSEIPTQKHKIITNGFWDNWFIDFGGDFISNYSNQEVGVNNNPFSFDRGNFAFDVSVGKWATPSFGMRVKIGAAWATQVNTPSDNPLFNQLQISAQPLLNLHNLFAGYKPRVWNTILYGGIGYHRSFDFSDNAFFVGAGWLNTFNVTKRFHINIDLYANMLEGDADGKSDNGSQWGGYTNNDWQIGWSIGCGFNLGKVGWDNAPDVDAIIAMNKAQ